MGMADRIRVKLAEGLAPQSLEVVDESERHKGHAGWQPGGETHFQIAVVSERFAGLGRVARQRLIYDLLAEEIAAGVHALRLSTKTPEEAG